MWNHSEDHSLKNGPGGAIPEYNVATSLKAKLAQKYINYGSNIHNAFYLISAD